MKLRALALALLACAVGLAGCGKEGSPSSSSESALSFPVATNVELTGSPTFNAIKARGKVVVGVKEDQPGLGFKDATTGQRSGFDIEIARLVAAGLGYGPDQIEYKAIPSAAREDAIGKGDVDFYVGTYTINDKRKQRVSFAGPYFIAGQGLLVRAAEKDITGKDTLWGKKVCSVTGSTNLQRVGQSQLTEADNIVAFQTFTQCVDQLLSKQVDAMSADDALLMGYVGALPEDLKLVGDRFSTEPYGIGLAKDDAVLRNKINDILQAAYDDGTWQQIFDATLGQAGVSASPPPLQRY